MARKKTAGGLRFKRTEGGITFSRPFFENGLWYVRRREPFPEGGRTITRIRLKAAPNATRTELEMEVTDLINKEAQARAKNEKLAEKGEDTIVRRSLREALAEWYDLRKGALRPMTAENLALVCIDCEDKRTGETRPGLWVRFFTQELPPKLRVENVDEITLKHIEHIFSKLLVGRAGRTCLFHYAMLRKFFRWAVAHHYASKKENPFEGFEVPQTWRQSVKAGKSRGQALSFEQCQRLLRACREPYSLTVERKKYKPGCWTQENTPPLHLFSFVLLALRTGLRCANVLGLAWKHINFDTAMIELPGDMMKAGMPFKAPVHPEALAHLREVLRARTEELGHAPAPDDRVIALTAVKRSRVKNGFKAALRRAGLLDEAPGFRVHDLRHTAGTLLAEHAPYAALQRLLGHSIASVTDRYTLHLGIDVLRAHLGKLPWFFPRTEQEQERQAN